MEIADDIRKFWIDNSEFVYLNIQEDNEGRVQVYVLNNTVYPQLFRTIDELCQAYNKNWFLHFYPVTDQMYFSIY